MVRRSRVVLLLAMVGSLLVAGPVSAAPAVHRAAVIVDTGTTVTRVCVRFTEESISGKEALDRAGVDPVYRSFGGTLGSAVCSLCGVGRSYADCLGSGGSSNYWVYWRAPAGSAAFTRSAFGVSSTRVRDGDVEGWRWGVSEAPPFALAAELCGPEGPSPSTTTPGASPPPPEARTAGSVAPAGRGARPAARTPSTMRGSDAAATTTSTAPGSQSGRNSAGDVRPLASGRRVSDTRPGGERSGPDGSLLAFGALMAGLVASIAVVRRRR